MSAGALVATTVAGAVAQSAVGLGTAGSFAVLGGAGVTNTGPSVINGDLGTCPTPAITGFPPGIVNGATHANDAVACGAQAAVTTAYNDAAGRAPDVTYPGPTDLGGSTLLAGVYKSPMSFAITGTLTLDGEANPSAVFIFQAASTLITEVNSHVVFVNGAQPCNVFWQVGSSATLGVGSTFVGTILALTSISANTGATVQGRLLARNASTTLDTNTITTSPCATTPTTVVTPTTTAAATPTTTAAASTPTTAAPTPTTEAPTVITALSFPTPGFSATATATGATGTGLTGAGAANPALGVTTTSRGASTPAADSSRSFARTGTPTRSKALAGGFAVMIGTLLVLLAAFKRADRGVP